MGARAGRAARAVVRDDTMDTWVGDENTRSRSSGQARAPAQSGRLLSAVRQLAPCLTIGDVGSHSHADRAEKVRPPYVESTLRGILRAQIGL